MIELITAASEKRKLKSVMPTCYTVHIYIWTLFSAEKKDEKEDESRNSRYNYLSETFV